MIRVAVAGAGIGGLTAALALAEVGCAVEVFERAGALAPVGAGVQLSPNASAVLARLNVLDALLPRATALTEVLMRRAGDGAALASIPFGEVAMARYGSPFLTVLRADLQAALLGAVQRRPAIAIRLGMGIEGWALGGRGVALRLPRGGDAEADGLVAADGLWSAHTRAVAGVGMPRATGRSAYRATLPAGSVEPEALLPRSNLWLGRRAHLVHYPVDAGRRINVVAILDEGATPGRADPWSEPAEAAAVERSFAGWAAPARRLIAAAPEWRRWPLFDRPPLPRWSDGPATLLGDAAHPMLPFLAQGAAQAIEDAAVLAACVRDTPGDLPTAFRSYEALRRPRTARVQAASRSQGRVYHLGRPASFARDLALRALSPSRLVAKVDWLYATPAEVRRFVEA